MSLNGYETSRGTGSPPDTGAVDLSERSFSSPKDQKTSGKRNLTRDTIDVAPPKPNIRYTKWGIFDIAYEEPSESRPFPLPYLSPSFLSTYWVPLQSFRRFVEDLWGFCKWRCAHYYTCILWLSLAPSISLHLASSIIFDIEKMIRRAGFRGLTMDALKDNLRYQIAGWVLCGVLTFHAIRTSYEAKATIGAHIRAHFLPKLMEASLKVDRAKLNTSCPVFPHSFSFGDFVPAWDSFERIILRARSVLAVGFASISMVTIIRGLNDFDAFVMSCLTALLFITTFLAPKNGAGGRPFVFWTTNELYNRMNVLFSIAFDYHYRPFLFRDGVADYFLEEYKRASLALGVVKGDIDVLANRLPAPWYWDLISLLVSKYPTELSFVFIFWAPSTSVISTILIFQYAIFTLQDSIRDLEWSLKDNSMIMRRLNEIKELYRLIDNRFKVKDSHLAYPANIPFNGASIDISNVSYRYQSSVKHDFAVDKVNLSIKPGQLVVITGVNGSGKTTLVNLISGLIQPTSGEVMVDNNQLQLYNGNDFRATMLFVAQNEYIYPFSLRENLLSSIPNGPQLPIDEDDLNEAAVLGGSLDLIKRHGYAAVLNPSPLPFTSTQGLPAESVRELCMKKKPDARLIPVSPGEHQRIIASRAFMRLKHGKIRLIILDEPTNALDTAAEANIFENFRSMAKRSGQTMVVVSHRLATIAKHADLIVCMNKGRIEEQGTHQDLVASGGQYSLLYNAQALKY